MDSTFTVLCDFDGTIAEQDVGNLLFDTFTDGSWCQFIQLRRSGHISSRECLMRECRAATVSREELSRFARAQSVETTFSDFRAYCGRRRIPPYIASDA